MDFKKGRITLTKEFVLDALGIERTDEKYNPKEDISLIITGEKSNKNNLKVILRKKQKTFKVKDN